MAEPSTIARPYAEAAFKLADEGGKVNAHGFAAHQRVCAKPGQSQQRKRRRDERERARAERDHEGGLAMRDAGAVQRAGLGRGRAGRDSPVHGSLT